MIFYLFITLSCCLGSLSALGNCRDGWVTFGESCYLFSHNQMSWPEAAETCKELYSRLATVMTAAEQQFLSTYLLHMHMNDPAKSNYHYWLDGTDLETEHTWRWASTGERLTYENWAPGEPNMGESENCLVLWGGGDFKMGDNTCTNKRNYICQQSLETASNIIG